MIDRPDQFLEAALIGGLFVTGPTKVLAQKYLLTNWPIIEKMARDALATGTFEDGQIKRVMI